MFVRVCVCVVVVVFFLRGIFLLYTEGSLVKPLKFPQDSGCLTHDEFLVILKGATP